MAKTFVAAAATALLLTLSACGGGGEAEAKDNIKENLLSNDANLAGTEVSDEQADCVADGVVDEIGTDKLQEYGLLDEDNNVKENPELTGLEEADADAMAETLVGCVDVQGMFEDQLGSLTSQMNDEQAQCISDALDDDTLEGLLSAQFQGEAPDAGGDFQSKMMACVTGG